MATYTAPTRDILFVLNDVLNVNQLTDIEAYAEATPDIVSGVVEEAAKLIENTLAPLNQSGDEQGCRLENGEVSVPDGYVDAYRQYWQGGWVGLSHDPEFGGQGLPYTLAKVVEEMVCGANVGFALYPGLTTGAFDSIEAHGTPEQKATYLGKMATGEWTGTMCMTEPQAGSDVGAVRTTATPQEDGSYKIRGSKIFITSGEHDLTDNIIHYVLARLPDAPAGVRGLSTFIVPKFFPNADGTPGERNDVKCISIEEKMGMHGSVTCTMGFDDAVGYLVGQPNQGIQNMFTMMNLARIMVSFQGLGQCELATQNAIAYAKERVQSKPLIEGGSGTIIDHPDVRRMLLTMKSITEGGRAMAYDTSIHVDLMRKHADESVREEAQDWVELTTPLCKAFLTDSAVDLGSTAVQIYGGHGYIREHGVEQIVRDAKITCLYEGTNGIQAMDLVRRKLMLHNGRLPVRFFDRVAAELDKPAATDAQANIMDSLETAVEALKEATDWMQQSFKSEPAGPASGAVPFLRAFSLCVLGYYWLRMVRAAGDDEFGQAKQVTGQFFAERLMAEVPGLCKQASAGGDTVMALDAAAF